MCTTTQVVDELPLDLPNIIPSEKGCKISSLIFQPHDVLPCSSRPDSSGFEHVFVGETRGGRTVIGFHNWIQLYLQEKLGHIDYKGYSVNANSPQVT